MPMRTIMPRPYIKSLEGESTRKDACFFFVPKSLVGGKRASVLVTRRESPHHGLRQVHWGRKLEGIRRDPRRFFVGE